MKITTGQKSNTLKPRYKYEELWKALIDLKSDEYVLVECDSIKERNNVRQAIFNRVFARGGKMSQRIEGTKIWLKLHYPKAWT